jgi:hypothetical protein
MLTPHINARAGKHDWQSILGNMFQALFQAREALGRPAAIELTV